MPNRPEVEYAVQRGLHYLHSQQQVDGGFVSYSAGTARPFKSGTARRTNFVPALMLAALAGNPRAEAARLCGGLARFLLTQKSPSGSFNYWANGAPERQVQPYPDDLDDTFCALSALYLYDSALIDERVLAQTVKLLVKTEASVGGPYRTWLAAPHGAAVWRDVDVAVNANVAYFLNLIGSPLPNLERLLADSLTVNQLASPYYPTAYPLLYYAARASGDTHRDQLLAQARNLQTDAVTALDQALCLTVRLRFRDSRSLTRAINALLAQQDVAGAWPAAAFCADPDVRGRPRVNGCPALTTAFVCEALQLYLEATRHTRPRSQSDRLAPRQDLRPRLLAIAEKTSHNLPSDLRQLLLQQLSELASGSNGLEIMSLPQQFSAALTQPAHRVSASFLNSLSLANLYGWLAYTVYDNFLDGSGQPELLPVANVAMRKSVSCFSEALPFHRPFQALLRNVFDTIDGANAWEQAHCRFACSDNMLTVQQLPAYGDLGQLANRSLGHGLPLLAVLLATGVDDTDADFKHLQRALTHYLIARQLNDDAHDWPQDMAKGHITYVVAQLLAAGAANKPGRYPLTPLVAAARKQFWQTTLPLICRELRRHVKAAQRALKQVRAVAPDNALTELLKTIDTSIEETLSKQGQAQAFLKHYGQLS